MNRERLKEIMLDQKEVFNRNKNLVDRNLDLDKYINTGQIVIITGVRRCGKSALLHLIRKKMKLKEAEYCYFNFDDERIVNDPDILEQVYLQHVEMYGREPVLFFDEIQTAAHWEKFVNRMYEKGIKVFITGSNGRLLSSEISTSITGRNKVIELFPLSFSEYLLFKGKQYDIVNLTSDQKALLHRDLSQYFETGGFPLVVRENDLELINGYFQDILYRDIVARYNLSRVNEIRQIALWFASNTGKLFSYSTLQEISGVKSTSSIKDYLWYYEQSFLFFYLSKFDYSVKKQVMNPKKVYAVDPAICHRLGFSFSENRGRILENIVFLELRRRGKVVFYHSGKYECDFLVMEGLQITSAIQVVWSLDQTNYDRETNGLKEAMYLYNLKEGLIIANYWENDIKEEDLSIQVVPVWKWLLTTNLS